MSLGHLAREHAQQRDEDLAVAVWEALDHIGFNHLTDKSDEAVAHLVTSEPLVRNFSPTWEECLPSVRSFMSALRRSRERENRVEDERVEKVMAQFAGSGLTPRQAEALEEAVGICEGTFRVSYPATNPAVLLKSARTVYLEDKSDQRDLRLIATLAWLMQVVVNNTTTLPDEIRQDATKFGINLQLDVIKHREANPL